METKRGLYLITSYPQHGKSELIKYLSYMAVTNYEWPISLFSPEEDTEDIIEDLCRLYLGKNVNGKFGNQCSKYELEQAIEWVNKFYTFVEFDGMADFNTLLAQYESLAESGVKMFGTDPWNYVAEGNDEIGYKFLLTALTHMKTFSKRYEVHNVIVEHQNKPVPNKQTGAIPKATKWNITGGQMWNKKCDCIIIPHSYWPEERDTTVEIEVVKVKNQRYNGSIGMVALDFDLKTGRYENKSFSSDQFIQSSIDDDEPF